jgi:dimethylaniline monooxygenase (N-oxide forming)
VIGNAYSGCELASLLVDLGAEVTHVFRRPVWILPRQFEENGKTLPLDLHFYKRKKSPAIPDIERNIQQATYFEALFGNPRDCHPDLAVDTHSGLPNFTAISDDYLQKVAQGSIQPLRGDFQFAGGKHIIVRDQDQIRYHEADLVLFATGFQADCDFLDPALQFQIGYKAEDRFMPIPLSDSVWSAAGDTLGFVGLYRGPFLGVMELQARWVAAVMSGQAEKPYISLEAMDSLRYQKHKPQFPYADYVSLCDRIASHIGCNPTDLDHPFIRQFKPELLELIAPERAVTPAQYRLHGPHQNWQLSAQQIRQTPA